MYAVRLLTRRLQTMKTTDSPIFEEHTLAVLTRRAVKRGTILLTRRGALVVFPKQDRHSYLVHRDQYLAKERRTRSKVQIRRDSIASH